MHYAWKGVMKHSSPAGTRTNLGLLNYHYIMLIPADRSEATESTGLSALLRCRCQVPCRGQPRPASKRTDQQGPSGPAEGLQLCHPRNSAPMTGCLRDCQAPEPPAPQSLLQQSPRLIMRAGSRPPQASHLGFRTLESFSCPPASPELTSASDAAVVRAQPPALSRVVPPGDWGTSEAWSPSPFSDPPQGSESASDGHAAESSLPQQLLNAQSPHQQDEARMGSSNDLVRLTAIGGQRPLAPAGDSAKAPIKGGNGALFPSVPSDETLRLVVVVHEALIG